ncbi:hypothetical protein Zmor_012326 [Zophobas morio]|uniref:ABC transporter domain-containing protein n=1 Tax=Zophobas morio TaxID=2755281 RepID=A0AA38HH00_9CUCU|nr:hypothetical protein Zmor_012326 [Zophobas morio]
MTPLEYIQSQFREKGLELEQWRQQLGLFSEKILRYRYRCEPSQRPLGRFGISGKCQTSPIKTLSDGQKSRIVFCWLAQKTPHLLLFDEPTNHLDMEAIDALAKAINSFEGFLVTITEETLHKSFPLLSLAQAAWSLSRTTFACLIKWRKRFGSAIKEQLCRGGATLSRINDISLRK